MSWFIDSRGRRGHVSTRIPRQSRDLEPRRYHPDDDDYPVSVWRKSYAAAVVSLRLAREGSDYPLYPGSVKVAFDAALSSACYGWPDVPTLEHSARIMRESAPRYRMGEPVNA